MAKRILILGGGVIGLSTAYYAVQRGFRVTVVDRATAGHEGCSYGNAGLVVPSHFVPLAAPGMVALGLKWMWRQDSPFWIKPRLDWELFDWAWKFWQASTVARVDRAAPLLRDLNLASRACFETLSVLSREAFGLMNKGLLVLCQTPEALDHEAKAADKARSVGISAEVLDQKKTAQLEPAVKMAIIGSVYFPQDCHLSPNRFMNWLRRDLEAVGVDFRWETEAKGWRISGSRVEALATARGEISADEFVLCGGAWSPALVRDLKLDLPMQAGKGYSLTLTHPPRQLSTPAILSEARVAVTPMGQSLRFGGTMEIAGLSETINPVRVGGIIKAASRYYPEFREEDFAEVPPWRGLRPCSPDGLPYLGRTSRFSNLSIATGHAMMGLSLGPITGKLMAEILSGEEPSIGIKMLDPDRYA